MRYPFVAGMFYPEDKENLELQLRGFFENSKEKSVCKAVISPHAGYVYSGQTAAYAISSLKPAKTFAVLGVNHSGIGPVFGTNRETWLTPLGKIKTTPLNIVFLEEDNMAGEHSIEVQLPFLQCRFKNFRIIPISLNQNFSDEFISKCTELGEILSEKNVSLVASSDFSHYLPLEAAKEMDEIALEKIKKLDIKGLFHVIEENDMSVCGFGPIAVAMSFAKNLSLKPKILHISSSGDETGDYSSVVTYYAIGFE